VIDKTKSLIDFFKIEIKEDSIKKDNQSICNKELQKTAALFQCGLSAPGW
jgi:hypothetical protein